MNSRSDWLKFVAEHYQHCSERIGNALAVFTQVADNLNIYYLLFCFLQIVQKQMFGATGT